MVRQPIHARMVGSNTCSAFGIVVSAGDPIRALCGKLTQLGHDPETPMTIWKGSKPWRLVAAIGRPDQMKIKAKSGGSNAL